jgi:hypothetical protein
MPLAHCVYFTLRDPSPENVAQALASCHELLSGHEGMVHFSAGRRGKEFTRPKNDQDFDVALVAIFADKEAHDRYQVHPRHVAFVETNGPRWKSVRIFDAWV